MYVLTSEHLNFQFLQYCTYIGPSSQTGKLCARFFSKFSCLTALSKNKILFFIPYVPTFDSSSKSMKSSFFWQPYMPRGPLTPPPCFWAPPPIGPSSYSRIEFSLPESRPILLQAFYSQPRHAKQDISRLSEQPYKEQWWFILNSPIGISGVF